MLALKPAGKLSSGAGLDVMDPVPLPPNHPLWLAKDVVITPHIAARSSDAVRRKLIIAHEDLPRYGNG